LAHIQKTHDTPSRDDVKRLGLIVNPVAGIGGRVGLKGSDGRETVEKARQAGAESPAPGRAVTMLRELGSILNRVEVITYPAEMGAQEAASAGLKPVVLGSIDLGHTTPADTREAALDVIDHGVDLLVFVGGDGTARDIYEAIGEREEIVVLGVPAGVKIHSSVYAVNPRRAAQLIIDYLQGRAEVTRREVMDIDEEAFRAGRVSARLYGYLYVPYESNLLQSSKQQSSGDNVAGLAQYVVDKMEPDCYYILGPGSTVKAVGDILEIDKTLLGVDVVRNGRLVAKDVGETELLNTIGDEPAKIVVTIIGGQGNLFGRGNQQLSPTVIRRVGRDNIIVVAAPSKLLELDGPLMVDTGDEECNEYLSGYIHVITDYGRQAIRKVEA